MWKMCKEILRGNVNLSQELSTVVAVAMIMMVMATPAGGESLSAICTLVISLTNLPARSGPRANCAWSLCKMMMVMLMVVLMWMLMVVAMVVIVAIVLIHM